MIGVNWEEITSHPQECSCGYCTVVKGECDGQGHDWRPTDRDSNALYCTRCKTTARRVPGETQDRKWQGPMVRIDGG